jgi:hypothetical protein
MSKLPARMRARSRSQCSRRGGTDQDATPIAIVAWEIEEFHCDVRQADSADAMDLSEGARGVLAGM